MKGLLVALFLFAVYVSAKAQPAEIGNLRLKINQELEKPGYEKDTAYINKINRLSYLYYALDADSLFFYARRGFDLSKNIGYQKGMAEGLRQIGNGYMYTGDFDQALSHYQQSLSIARKINDSPLICLAISNIGLNYSNIGKYNDALTYTLQAYSLALKLGNGLRIAGELDNLGEIYAAKKEYAKAADYAAKALKIAADLKSDYYVAFLNSSLGAILFKQGQYQRALGYYTSAHDYYAKTNDLLGITNTSLLIAKVYLQYKNYPVAFSFALKSMQIAETKRGKKDIADAAQTLADIYEAKGDYKMAVEYLKKEKIYNDSLFNDETQKRLYELQAEYKYQQMEADLKSTDAKKDLQNKHMLQSKKQQVVIAALIIFTLGIIVIALYRSRAEKLRINKVLQEKNIEISRQKEEIENQAEQLRVSNGQKDKLFSIIAHDLRSPFISLQNLLTLFKDDAVPVDKAKEFIERLNVNVDQTAGLVTNLLYWASSQMNGMVANPVRFEINGVIGEVVAGVEKSAADKGIVLTSNGSGEVHVLADKDMIQLVVRNLLWNAVKFCSRSDTISISVKGNGQWADVCIADTGVGIAVDVLQKINKGESITTYGTSREKGTGLGLMLCKDFIARNGGRFTIESKLGEGSRFCFALKKAEEPATAI